MRFAIALLVLVVVVAPRPALGGEPEAASSQAKQPEAFVPKSPADCGSKMSFDAKAKAFRFDKDLFALEWTSGTVLDLAITYGGGTSSEYPLRTGEGLVSGARVTAPTYTPVAEALARWMGEASLLSVGDFEVALLPLVGGCTLTPIIKDGRSAVFLRGVGLTAAFNTLQTTERQRAKMVFEKVALPILARMQKGAAKTASFAIALTWSTRDFSQDSVADRKTETLVVFVPGAALKAYEDAEIAVEEVAAKSTTILFGRGELAPKRVSL